MSGLLGGHHPFLSRVATSCSGGPVAVEIFLLAGFEPGFRQTPRVNEPWVEKDPFFVLFRAANLSDPSS